MTDKVVDFQSRLAAREVEYAEYNKRMQHLGALFEMMSPVISKMRELGADERAIARALRVIVEELEANCGLARCQDAALLAEVVDGANLLRSQTRTDVATGGEASWCRMSTSSACVGEPRSLKASIGLVSVKRLSRVSRRMR